MPPAPTDDDWTLGQRWHDLLFAHWPFPASALERFVPPGLLLDTFDGEAWLGVVPFRMTAVRPRGVPALPWISAFPELNVRTYARTLDGARRGVVFLSLDAANPLAVWTARAWFHLPYFRARMRCEPDGCGIRYSSRRTHRDAPPAELRARYRPTGVPYRAAPGSLEEFLTERYWLFTTDRRGRTLSARVRHEPWPLQPAEAELEHDTMAAAHGLRAPELPPLLHFARSLEVVAWSPKPLQR